MRGLSKSNRKNCLTLAAHGNEYATNFVNTIQIRPDYYDFIDINKIIMKKALVD